jgi:hypothetical protein
METSISKLWRVTARFPAHCGSPAYSNDLYYETETIDKAIQNHNQAYSHSSIEAVAYLGIIHMELPG